MELLLPLAGFALSVLVFLGRDRLSQRRGRRLRNGAAVELRALLGPETGRLHRGRVVLAPAGASWVGRGRRIVLDGGRVLSMTDEGAGPRARPDDVLLRLRLKDGSRARVVLQESDAVLLGTRLRSDEPGARRTGEPSVVTLSAPRRRRWPLVLLAVAGLWLVAWVYLVAGGRTVTATVTGGDGQGSCDVAWAGPSGQRRTANVDCADQPAGTAVRVWELAPPFTGQAVDPAWTEGSVLVLGAIVAAAGGAGLWWDRRERAAGGELVSAARPDEPEDLPGLTEQDLAPGFESPPAVLARYASYARRQVPGHGWENRCAAHGARPPSLRRHLPRALAGPAVGLAAVLLMTAPSPWTWWVLHTSPTATATATSSGDEVSSGPGPIPEEYTVDFVDARGRHQHADIATLGTLPAGAQVRITYAVHRPGWARLDGPGDGLDRFLLLAGAGSLLALGVAGFRTLRLASVRRRVRQAAGQPARPALATLTATPDGEPLLLVCDPVTQPVLPCAVPLARPLPHGAAASFPADRGLPVQVHGNLVEGEAVVTDVPGRGATLWPVGPAWRPDRQELLVLLDSAAAFDAGEDEDESSAAPR